MPLRSDAALFPFPRAAPAARLPAPALTGCFFFGRACSPARFSFSLSVLLHATLVRRFSRACRVPCAPSRPRSHHRACRVHLSFSLPRRWLLPCTFSFRQPRALSVASCNAAARLGGPGFLPAPLTAYRPFRPPFALCSPLLFACYVSVSRFPVECCVARPSRGPLSVPRRRSCSSAGSPWRWSVRTTPLPRRSASCLCGSALPPHRLLCPAAFPVSPSLPAPGGLLVRAIPPSASPPGRRRPTPLRRPCRPPLSPSFSFSFPPPSLSPPGPFSPYPSSSSVLVPLFAPPLVVWAAAVPSLVVPCCFAPLRCRSPFAPAAAWLRGRPAVAPRAPPAALGRLPRPLPPFLPLRPFPGAAPGPLCLGPGRGRRAVAVLQRAGPPPCAAPGRGGRASAGCVTSPPALPPPQLFPALASSPLGLCVPPLPSLAAFRVRPPRGARRFLCVSCLLPPPEAAPLRLYLHLRRVLRRGATPPPGRGPSFPVCPVPPFVLSAGLFAFPRPPPSGLPCFLSRGAGRALPARVLAAHCPPVSHAHVLSPSPPLRLPLPASVLFPSPGGLAAPPDFCSLPRSRLARADPRGGAQPPGCLPPRPPRGCPLGPVPPPPPAGPPARPRWILWFGGWVGLPVLSRVPLRVPRASFVSGGFSPAFVAGRAPPRAGDAYVVRALLGPSSLLPPPALIAACFLSGWLPSLPPGFMFLPSPLSYASFRLPALLFCLFRWPSLRPPLSFPPLLPSDAGPRQGFPATAPAGRFLSRWAAAGPGFFHWVRPVFPPFWHHWGCGVVSGPPPHPGPWVGFLASLPCFSRVGRPLCALTAPFPPVGWAGAVLSPVEHLPPPPAVSPTSASRCLFCPRRSLPLPAFGPRSAPPSVFRLLSALCRSRPASFAIFLCHAVLLFLRFRVPVPASRRRLVPVCRRSPRPRRHPGAPSAVPLGPPFFPPFAPCSRGRCLAALPPCVLPVPGCPRPAERLTSGVSLLLSLLPPFFLSVLLLPAVALPLPACLVRPCPPPPCALSPPLSSVSSRWAVFPSPFSPFPLALCLVPLPAPPAPPAPRPVPAAPLCLPVCVPGAAVLASSPGSFSRRPPGVDPLRFPLPAAVSPHFFSALAGLAWDRCLASSPPRPAPPTHPPPRVSPAFAAPPGLLLIHLLPPPTPFSGAVLPPPPPLCLPRAGRRAQRGPCPSHRSSLAASDSALPPLAPSFLPVFSRCLGAASAPASLFFSPPISLSPLYSSPLLTALCALCSERAVRGLSARLSLTPPRRRRARARSVSLPSSTLV
ncbi:unnamed protein product [Pleuronectes platessa]|uniref:Uncharacterized protein n=1 Tax=Pleuronectes platessa TaxID=8262 RepID=A0A9N7UTJ0_PLEPL|nr:unnamed protein product [Pleuronectes platessa]